MLDLYKFIENLDGKPKVGIIAGIGDRREEDNKAMGRMAAEMFDEVIIRQDKHLRGKTEEELITMLMDGIKEVDPNKKVQIFKSEREAIDSAITNAKDGSLIVMCSDVVPDALAQVQAFKEKENEGLYV